MTNKQAIIKNLDRLFIRFSNASGSIIMTDGDGKPGHLIYSYTTSYGPGFVERPFDNADFIKHIKRLFKESNSDRPAFGFNYDRALSGVPITPYHKPLTEEQKKLILLLSIT